MRECWRLTLEGDPQKDEPLVDVRMKDGNCESIPVTREPDEELRVRHLEEMVWDFRAAQSGGQQTRSDIPPRLEDRHAEDAEPASRRASPPGSGPALENAYSRCDWGPSSPPVLEICVSPNSCPAMRPM